MYKLNFTENEMAVIYESVKHMMTVRDVNNNQYKITSRSILDKISEQNSKVASAFYVSDNLIDD